MSTKYVYPLRDMSPNQNFCWNRVFFSSPDRDVIIMYSRIRKTYKYGF